MSAPARKRSDSEVLTATNRSDFTKRLFAVAISVGFATTLAKMDFITGGHRPLSAEWQFLAALGTGVMLSVQSWDGYLASINKRPLYGWRRFTIDIFLIFTYLFLLLVSAHVPIWLWTIAAIFLTYVVWDICSIVEFPETYLPSHSAELKNIASWGEAFDVYRGGLLNRPGYYRGPVITLSWATYFIVLAAISKPQGGLCNLILSCIIFVIYGLWFYRRDKNHEIKGSEIKGYGMLARVLFVASGIAAVWLAGLISPPICRFMAQCM